MPPTDLAAERRRLAKKRKVAAEKVDIPSPRAQLERNREAAAASVAENRAREERRNEKKRVQIATREEDHAFLLAQQRAAVEEGAVDRPANERQSRGLVHVARTPAGPRINVSLPRSEYVEEVDYETLRAPFKEQECSNFADVRDFVKAQREVAVLCALPDGNGVRTWNDLQLIDGDERGLNWYSPGHWLTLSRAWTQRSAPWMKRLNESGNYNDVLVLSAGAPLDDPAHWPPQLRPGYDMKPSILRGDGAFVVRMTRTDPFAKGPGDGKSPAKVYRSMKMEALVMEMAHTLHAASLGVGPAVYAAVSWPWDQVPGTGVQRYGLLMVLERAAGDMVHYQDDLLRKHPLGCSINGPPRELREHAECAGAWLAGLCYHVAWSGFINFDVKPSNLLMCQREDTFCMTDFDHMYHRQVTDAEGAIKARFFVNLLLLCMHVRAYSKRSFAASFFKPLAGELLRLWKQAVSEPEAFGQGSVWLRSAVLTRTSSAGSFNHHKLSRIQDPGQRLATMLSMMVFEYLFDNEPPKRPPPVATEWPGWKTKGSFFTSEPPLVPQLLRFVLFYNIPVPDEYAVLLGA